MAQRRFVGLDVGAETIKVAELAVGEGGPRVVRRALVGHGKAPGPCLLDLLGGWDWDRVDGAAVTGRLSRLVALPRLPTRRALLAGQAFLHGEAPVTIVSIGSRGFSVTERRARGAPVHRENSRCAQGTGNFLRQLVERFGLTVEQASDLADGVEDPAPLSGRCPVILKTDMTHLANGGERRERILAGLLDAIAENVEVLVKPRVSPPDVLLTGGVSRARRVREHFRRFLARHGMRLVEADGEEALWLEALGCALHAAERGTHAPPLSRLLRPAPPASLEVLPPLAGALSRVRRLPRPPAPPPDPGRPLLLGFDVGSTGSKLVALDAGSGQPAWEAWRRTAGDPVGAAQALLRQFLEGPHGAAPVVGFGATGSGREIVGSLLASCYGPGAAWVLNEIAAHARGAVHADPRVDTIFEIGGQDAKYIRLEEGRVVDAAMNEACSAGTGSFIEEQGRRFEGLDDVARLAEVAREADGAVALGQHCSIFMAEVIDEAVAAGAPRQRIVAGLYDSVVANYLNRVKGPRSVGEVVFCQGMPFSADALAAAVARQTGAEVIVPPSPGTTGALGIALLAAEALPWRDRAPLDPRRFLEARLERRDAFVCGATSGCGGAGNKCRIDRLTTLVAGERRRFTWGGACALHDQGTRTHALPALAPDPFREREALVDELLAPLLPRRGGRRVALTDEFTLKGLLPFFATFLHGLGLDLEVVRGAGRAALKRGIEQANVPYCAPMQLFHGLAAELAERGTDLVFLPMLRHLPRVAGEPHARTCPIVQGAPDVLALDLAGALGGRAVSPVVDLGEEGVDSPAFEASCRALATRVGAGAEAPFRAAFAAARAAQRAFDGRLLALGREALRRCREEGLLPVVVLGRAYTLHNDVLNSNLPAILREQGAVAIPLDAFPVPDAAPVFPSMFWGFGQRILRAAWQVRRSPGVYALFASNYSCGPDSFTLHFASRLLEGKPFAVIETDGHAGDAGTRTRVEAFLHCVREDRAAPRQRPAAEADRLTVRSRTLPEIRAAGEAVLVPPMGPGSGAMAAALRGLGLRAEALPEPTGETLRAGRRHTSGKECLPMAVTLGGLLERLAKAGPGERFAFFMPGASGPCRFGVYKELHQLVLDRLGESRRVSLWSPPFENYFQGVSPAFGALALTALTAADVLRDLHAEVRPVETRPGAADELHGRATAALHALLESAGGGDLSVAGLLAQAASGRLWGVPALLDRAARELSALRGAREAPLVLVVGEIYVRNQPFSSGFAVEALARRGIRARVGAVTEFVAYSDLLGKRERAAGLTGRLDGWVRRRIATACHEAGVRHLGWGPLPRVAELVESARGYLREELHGEAVLTVGSALHAVRHGEADAVLAVGPLECMPSKLAETQLQHAGEREGLLALSLSLTGEPVDPDALDAFAFEVHARFEARRRAGRPAPAPLLDRLLPGLSEEPPLEEQPG